MGINLFKDYSKDTSGSFAATFAVGLMMLMVGVSAAVDYNGMARTKRLIKI